MGLRIAAVLLAVTAQAAADPCKVTIVEAPDDVTAEISAWVAQEPSCARELAVTVVATEDGLVLSTRDPNGRVRERVVPDAQSAAVLVVSWMADDSIASPAVEAPKPSTAVSTAVDDELPLEVQPPTVVAKPRGPRRLVLGALGGPNGGGFRGQLDLVRGHWWYAGIAGGGRHVEDRDHDIMTSQRDIAQARAVIGLQRKVGPVTVRWQFGFGVDAIRTAETKERRVEPKGEVGLLGVLPVRGVWSVIGGPIVQKGKDKPEPSMFLGVQRSL